ncbi:putative E3 ubiquitin-protein ligase RNF144A-A [Larimichthys crocea]|uniref:RBR-type E3 ubiquitin transferase n=7 Tax=Percomorphaceae TaxID=1489872 RepID=A0A6G0IF77_LARCR|nr:putative E3 ubiquitin-protein ligase RNF144A-A [Larimichthys crocea]
MQLSSVVTSPKLLLQLCISTVQCFLSSVFSKVRYWTTGACKGTSSALSPVDNKLDQKEIQNATIPTSVNYHFTRKCNYKCGFCFHTAKTSFVLPLEEAKRGLTLLKESGMEKINFSGGEPFLHDKGEFLGKLVQFCKQDLQLPSVSIVSNGSMIKEKWFQKYGDYLDILAVSCDSFDEETNQLIGRAQGRKSHLDCLYKIRNWCQQYKVAFKINSVINTFNVDEDMVESITSACPLPLEGLPVHSSVSCLVPESNEKMRNSYLILDEYMRFLDCREGRKDPSKSILDDSCTDLTAVIESRPRFLVLQTDPTVKQNRRERVSCSLFICATALSQKASSVAVKMTTARYRPTWELAVDPLVSCKLCLGEFPLEQMTTITQCQCVFCTLCLKQYVELLIKEGLETAISCPDSACPKRGHLQENEIECMVATEMMQRYKKLQFEREVLLDPCRTWCPSSTCQAVCQLKEADSPALPQLVQCAVCALEFCSACKANWHPGQACQENNLPITSFLPGENSSFYKNEEDDAPIKRCPKCKVYIERDEGCAQMMCKNCKHAFCWYCLESLDDDFLLIHYDKGPCRNKLGHSRASVIWHRTQVVGIFAGFGLLLLVASPFLLLATPIVLCCKCKCSKGDDDPLPT